jgi:hypothetical protein
LELQRGKEHKRTEDELWEWAMEHREEIRAELPLTTEEHRRRMREIFDPGNSSREDNAPTPVSTPASVGPPTPPASIQGESSSIKPAGTEEDRRT